MPQHKPLPPREWLLENLRYEPETGLFRWIKGGPGRQVDKPPGHRAYKPCGTPKAIQINFGEARGTFPLHRLAWLMMTGDDPGDLTIDHVNRNPFDNKWKNLRLADHSLQMKNRRTWGRSKYKGVNYRKKGGRWQAFAWINGKMKHLGYYATEEEAAAVAAPYYTS